MKRLGVLCSILLALSIGSATADVQRFQIQNDTLVLTLNYFGATYVHTFQITLNPCNGSFTGVGSVPVPGGSYQETISGTLVGNQISLTNIYTSGPETGRVSHVDGTLPGQLTGYSNYDSQPQINFTVGMLSATVITTSTSNFKNHGEYVSSVHGLEDAAHSCIGMPLQSNQQ